MSEVPAGTESHPGGLLRRPATGKVSQLRRRTPRPVAALPAQLPLSLVASAEYCIIITKFRGTGSKINRMANRSDNPKKHGFCRFFSDLALTPAEGTAGSGPERSYSGRFRRIGTTIGVSRPEVSGTGPESPGTVTMSLSEFEPE